MNVICAKCNGTGKKENQFFVEPLLGIVRKREKPSREKACKVCRGRGEIEMVDKNEKG